MEKYNLMVATDFALLEHRQDLGIMFFRWKANTTASQIREGYEFLLENSHPDGVNCWLIDTRRRGAAKSEEEHWFFTDFLAEIKKQLKKRLFIGVLATPSHFEHIQHNIGFEKVQNLLKGSLVTMEFFNAEQEAVNWLQQQQIKA